MCLNSHLLAVEASLRAHGRRFRAPAAVEDESLLPSSPADSACSSLECLDDFDTNIIGSSGRYYAGGESSVTSEGVVDERA